MDFQSTLIGLGLLTVVVAAIVAGIIGINVFESRLENRRDHQPASGM